MNTSSICSRLAAYAAFFFILLTNQALFAQNTFPATGNVGIGNGTTPVSTLLDVGSAVVPSYVPSGSNISGLQVRTFMGQPNFSAGSSFYNELGVANNASQETMQIYSVSSQPSGTTARAIPLFVFQNYTGGGSIGDVRVIESDGAMSGSGTVTNWYQFEGSAASTSTGAITNGYGFYMGAWSGTVTNKYGVYINDATATNYFGGPIGIGTVNTFGYSLAVNGSAIFTQAIVKLYANWPDYVFKKGYVRPSLISLSRYIKANNHLPGLPSADSVAKNGIDLGANQARLLQKIEELTLYIIEQDRKIDALQKANKRLDALQAQIDELRAAKR
jgi:hypothetical protein